MTERTMNKRIDRVIAANDDDPRKAIAYLLGKIEGAKQVCAAMAKNQVGWK